MDLLLSVLAVYSGGKPGGDGAEVRPGDGSPADHALPAGGRPVTAAPRHAAQQDGLRAAPAHQTEPGDGDRHLQEAAGRRGRVNGPFGLVFSGC